MTLKVLILGYGSFGRSLFHVLGRKPELSLSVFLRTPNPDHFELQHAEFVYHRPEDIPLPLFDIVIVALPSYAIMESLSAIPQSDAIRAVFVSCAKGIDFASGLFPSQLIKTTVKAEHIAILSGPSFAEELLADKRTCVTVATNDHKIGRFLREQLTTQLLGIQLTQDTHGLEILGVAKNLIALGSGMIDGLELSENLRAAFISAGIKELMRILPQLGGDPLTAISFGGVGDILLTSVSSKSRNYRMGQVIGRRQSREDLMSEGLYSATSFARYLVHAKVKSRYFETVTSSIAQPETIVDAIELD